MKAHTSYIRYQMARFGVLRFNELEALCSDRCSKTVLYENVAELIQSRHIERFCHPDIYRTAYRATRLGFKVAVGEIADRLPDFREMDVKHSLRVAQVLIDLARHDHVSGIATELELPREVLRGFSHSKVPDGIVQVSRDGRSYELAIEVEVSPKNTPRCEEFLNKYQEAFSRPVLCSGVIVVCDLNEIHERYRTQLEKRDEAFRKRVLLVRGPSLESLNPEVYGRPGINPGKSAEKRRSHSVQSGTYSPIVFEKGPAITKKTPPETGRQTGFLKNKENLQPTSQSGT